MTCIFVNKVLTYVEFGFTMILIDLILHTQISHSNFNTRLLLSIQAQLNSYLTLVTITSKGY